MRKLERGVLLALMLFVGMLSLAGLADVAEIRGRSADISLDVISRMVPFESASPAPKLVFVDIDEASLKTIGQWPWPRAQIAKLIDKINSKTPLVIGIDILMLESGRFTRENIASVTKIAPEKLKNIVDGDALLGEAISRAPLVMASNLVHTANGDLLYRPSSVAQIGDGANNTLLTVPGVRSPVEALQTSPGAGFVNLSLEHDKIVRQVPLIARIGDKVIPSFALEMLRVAQGASGHIVRFAGVRGNSTTQIKTGNSIIATDERGFFALHHGYSMRFKSVSAGAILADSSADWRPALKDAIIVIGSSAAGLKDIHTTPLEAAIPGPLIHLHTLEQILSGRILTKSTALSFLEIIASAIATSFMVWLMLRLGLIHALILLPSLTAIIAWGYVLGFKIYGYLGNPVFVLSLMVAVSLLTLALRAMLEDRRRKRLRSAFGQYLSPKMVERIDAAGVTPSLGGETANATIMFMDIRSFTPLTETLIDDPQRLTLIVNTLMERATAIILENGGTLDKYMGDALMAFWGAPLPQRNYTAKSIEAAQAIEAIMPAINAELDSLLPPQHKPIAIGIGIASGRVVVGNFGSRFRFGYSCLGDAVNLAARLESFSKNTGLITTLCEETARLAPDKAIVTIDAVSVYGKAEKVKVATPLALSPETLALHETMRKKSSQKAKRNLLEKLKALPDYPQSLISYYKSN